MRMMRIGTPAGGAGGVGVATGALPPAGPFSVGGGLFGTMGSVPVETTLRQPSAGVSQTGMGSLVGDVVGVLLGCVGMM